MRRALGSWAARALIGGSLIGYGARALAEDRHPYLMLEPTEYTDVIDAFEGDEPMDVNVKLSYVRSEHDATIEHEQANPGDQIGGRYLPIAQSRQVTNALSLEIDAGVWRDLMVFARLPVVLSDTRELRWPDAANCGSAACNDRADRILRSLGATASQAPLFDPNFNSATRSGVPALEFGAAWGIANQYRTPYLPTWVVSAETRIGVGKLMRPCQDGASCETGVNRGTVRLELASRWSYRYRYVEPYLGLSYAHEWATSAKSRFEPQGLGPQVDSGLPSLAETTLGAAIVVFEDRGRFQRLSIDVRGRAGYVSAGRDYSPLFDALGTAQVSAPPSVAGPATAASTGLTNVASYGRFGLELAVAIRAARYVRFRLGGALWHETSHLITDASSCVDAGDTPCAPEHVNALYRPIIDLPGQRFRVDGELTYDLFASATGQF